MRISIDLDETHLRALDRLATREQRSRAALAREAVAEYLDRRVPQTAGNAFGLWGELKIDGLRYQEKIRREW
jgi:predicted transcriptional regulator